MQQKSKLRDYNTTKLQNSRRSEHGYMLITLMLFVALITIALLAVLPDIKQQIVRDREEELMHRGTAYMRAIQHYYKKFGRYPNRVEDLESTNNLRFLRRRYTDPINRDPKTGKERDFKFMHQQDLTLNSAPVLGQMPGQSGSGSQGGFGASSGGLNGSQGGFGSSQGGFGSSQGGFGSSQGGFGSSSGGFGPSSGGFGGTQGGIGGTQGGFGAQSNASQPAGGAQTSASSSSDNSSAASGSSSSSGSSGSSSPLSGPTFGGGPILGVASLSKDKTIRVFFDKSHYNDWWFVYTPALDKGGLLTGPVNPNMQAATSLIPGQVPGLTPGQAQGLGQALGLGQGQGQGLGQGLGMTSNGGNSLNSGAGGTSQSPPSSAQDPPPPQ